MNRAGPGRDGMLTGAEPLDGLGESGDRFALPYDSRMANHLENSSGADNSDDEAGSRNSQSRREWLAAQRDNRCIQVVGDSMAPILADGASVAYAKGEEEIEHLDGKMVVTWVESQPLVRWFQNCGRFALLRAEKSADRASAGLGRPGRLEAAPSFQACRGLQFARTDRRQRFTLCRDRLAVEMRLLTSSDIPRNREAPESCHRRYARSGRVRRWL